MRLLRLKDVQDKIGRKHSWIYSQIALGKFPAPVRHGVKVVAWPEHEIDNWIAAQIAKRDALTSKASKRSRL